MKTTSLPSRSIGCAVALLVLVGAISACSNDSSSESDGTSTSTTHAGTSSTTAATVGDQSATAQTATLTLEDLGASWVVYPADEPMGGEDLANECDGGLAGLPESTVAESEVFQYGGVSRFVRSKSYVYADIADAQTAIDRRLGNAFIECNRVRLEKIAQRVDPNLLVITDGPQTDTASGVYRGTVIYKTQPAGDNSEEALVASTQYDYYRAGTTVIELIKEAAYHDDDADDVDENFYGDVNAAIETLAIRVDPSIVPDAG